jgi:hypothetical protein
LTVTVQDTSSGLTDIEVVSESNTTRDVGEHITGFAEFTNEQGSFEVAKENPDKPASITFKVTDGCGNTSFPDPVVATLRSGTTRFTHLPYSESRLTITNGRPGLRWVQVTTNGRRCRVMRLRARQRLVLVVSRAMRRGSRNVVRSRARGPGRANLLIDQP